MPGGQKSTHTPHGHRTVFGHRQSEREVVSVAAKLQRRVMSAEAPERFM